jgi:two-component system, OmpR family, alkaline phosphatase synthesis response regulator PhoP
VSEETILVVDDDAHIVELAEMYLRNEGFRVLRASSGKEALGVVDREAPALMVLDLMLPEMDGWEVCRQVRQRSNLPIIMLTARSDDVDKIVGLELGADDYVTKPFNPRELAARVKAVLRRGGGDRVETRPVLRVGELEIDIAAREVSAAGKSLSPLRTKEFDLLVMMAQHEGVVLTREQLLEGVWGFEYYGETRTVDVHVARVRRWLRGTSVTVETVWGVGYKMVAG